MSPATGRHYADSRFCVPQQTVFGCITRKIGIYIETGVRHAALGRREGGGKGGGVETPKLAITGPYWLTVRNVTAIATLGQSVVGSGCRTNAEYCVTLWHRRLIRTGVTAKLTSARSLLPFSNRVHAHARALTHTYPRSHWHTQE